jgi:hypothetical protein
MSLHALGWSCIFLAAACFTSAAGVFFAAVLDAYYRQKDADAEVPPDVIVHMGLEDGWYEDGVEVECGAPNLKWKDRERPPEVNGLTRDVKRVTCGQCLRCIRLGFNDQSTI